MAWTRFPYDDEAIRYTPASLKKAWKRLHAGDAQAYPREPGVIDAWIAFHAGQFEQAARLGRAERFAGYAAANKATCIYASYLERSRTRKLVLLQEVVARCEQQQEVQPECAAAYYWHAYALGRYAQGVSVIEALAKGTGTKVAHSLERALAIAPSHADAHIALGVYHAEVIDKVGSLVGRLTYGVSKEQSLKHFRKALELNPRSAIGRLEYARALRMLEGKTMLREADRLLEEAVEISPMDAMEWLDREAARSELGA